MKIPLGFPKAEGKICLLKKALYGLNQAPQRWFKRMTDFLKSQGLIQLKSDKCVFKTINNSLYLAIHVDDGIILSRDDYQTSLLLDKLKIEFEVVIEDEPKSYLGFEIDINDQGITITQSKYAEHVLQRYGMDQCRTVKTPLVTPPKSGKPSEEAPEDFPYREIVGSLQHLSCKTRPDITHAVNFVSRYMENPDKEDTVNVKRILRYLRGSTQLGIHFPANGSPKIQCYSDSDYAGSGIEGKFRSTSGYIIFLAGGPVIWGSKLQKVVASSTFEAEFVAAAQCCKQLMYLKTLSLELTNETIPAHLHEDNQSSLKLIVTRQPTSKSRHINVRYFLVCEAFAEKCFELSYCETQHQLADIFTKPLLVDRFGNLRNQICMQYETKNCL